MIRKKRDTEELRALQHDKTSINRARADSVTDLLLRRVEKKVLSQKEELNNFIYNEDLINLIADKKKLTEQIRTDHIK